MIFVDSSAFVALSIVKDKFNKRASRWWLQNKGVPLVTSNLIFIETLGWIRHKAGKTVAVKIGDYLTNGEGLQKERVNFDDEQEAWELFQKLNGRGLSMVDCTSIILMKRLKIKDIFTFDQDFKKLGLKVFPK